MRRGDVFAPLRQRALAMLLFTLETSMRCGCDSIEPAGVLPFARTRMHASFCS
jgi:hypothetical protein